MHVESRAVLRLHSANGLASQLAINRWLVEQLSNQEAGNDTLLCPPARCGGQLPCRRAFITHSAKTFASSDPDRIAP
eukprot:5743970-Pleurochrysis_carterae.AAC.2